jgi:nitrogen fixation NifU-like protein
MTLKVKGKSRAETTALVHAFENLVTGASEEAPSSLGDLRLLRGVRKFPQRVKCAILAWRALEQAMHRPSGEASVSTETDG